ncbi:MAG: AAA family ATPase [Gemmatimonadaceae bacterium]|nr:AAA family ATPase [Gemmatimonadaceae bacterium]NUQ91285.1 AAA family ATPase [Gemmatimonadaceae bacterium]NUR21065.1 AAA family ATPase [Gemmatimonadaceae bacterium]NUS97494.1 AAA family ATPase [Gemmatimonadaceae bacterium]
MATTRERDNTSGPGARARTGIAGLDAVLGGGLPPDRLYLVDGEPGAGKTTLALQFLLAGEEAGERGLYVTLSETADELRGAAESHGWNIDHIRVLELSAIEGATSEEVYTLFHPSEVELQQTVDTVLAAIDRERPQRVVFDSLSELRLLARDPLRFRRQILTLKQFFVGRGCSVMLLDDRSAPETDLQLHSIAHGVIILEQLPTAYGAERRRIEVRKLRGVRFRGGYHDFRIRTGGIEVYPRIYASSGIERELGEPLTSGSAELDAILGGGIERGTSTLVTGAAGTGKTVLSAMYAAAACARGEKARMFMFDERRATFLTRARLLGLGLEAPLADGRFSIRQVEPTELSPGEFANEVVRSVEEDGVSLICIDSVNGYMHAMPAEQQLIVQVHELLTYLANRGVTTIMTLVQSGIFGSPVDDAAEVSYLADTVILLRYFEFAGAVRQAVSVVKKRSGDHERTIRECRVEEGGFRVGEPLDDFTGVLTGVPQYRGASEPLMDTGGSA